MNIPPKYEDVVAQLEAALAREAALQTSLDAVTFNLDKTDKVVLALREELDRTKKAYEAYGIDFDRSEEKAEALQQRLTVAEKRAGELEAAAQEMLRVAGIANQGSRAYTRAIINLNAALKPVAEVKS